MPATSKRSDKIDWVFDAPTQSSFKITPYKTCLYILLVELEKKQAGEVLPNDCRSYYAFCMWTLISQSNLSLPILKCYIYTFMNEFCDLFKPFINSLNTYRHKEILPDSEQLLFNQKCYPNFVKPLSLIGFFVRNYELEFLMMDTKKRFQFIKQWSEYLNVDRPSDDEINTFSQEWNIDISETLKEIKEFEVEKVPEKKKAEGSEVE